MLYIKERKGKMVNSSISFAIVVVEVIGCRHEGWRDN